MARIALIEPRGSNTLSANTAEPLALCYLAAALRQEGHETKILQQGGDDYELAEKALAFRPDLLGLSLITCTTPNALHLAKQVKERAGIPIVVGGVHPSMDPAIGHDPAIDIVAIGEGERTLAEIVRAYEAKRSPVGIAGTAVSVRGQLVFGPPRERIKDLDEIPFPARDGLPDDYVYRSPIPIPLSEQRGRYATVSGSRGCRYACTFCTTPKLWGPGRVAERSLENLLDEVELLVRSGKDLIEFRDEDFTRNRDRLLALTEGIEARGLQGMFSWISFGRVDDIIRDRKVDEYLLGRLAQSGCCELIYGFETGDEKLSGKIGKAGLTFGKKVMAAKATADAGISVAAAMMIGLPGETEESLAATRRFLETIPYDRVRMAFATPFKGTSLYRLCEREGLLLTGDDGAYTSETPVIKTPVGSERLTEFRRETLRDLYGSPGYLARCRARIEKDPRFAKAYDEWFAYLRQTLE